MKYVVLIMGILTTAPVVAAPNYTETEKREILQNLSKANSGVQQKHYDEMSDYHKKMFQLTRDRVGGYEDVVIEKNDNLDGLTDAEKQSVIRTRLNNERIKQAINGF